MAAKNNRRTKVELQTELNRLEGVLLAKQSEVLVKDIDLRSTINQLGRKLQTVTHENGRLRKILRLQSIVNTEAISFLEGKSAGIMAALKEEFNPSSEDEIVWEDDD